MTRSAGILQDPFVGGGRVKLGQRDNVSTAGVGLLRRAHLNAVSAAATRDERENLGAAAALDDVDVRVFGAVWPDQGRDNIDAALLDRHAEILVVPDLRVVRARFALRQLPLDRAPGVSVCAAPFCGRRPLDTAAAGAERHHSTTTVDRSDDVVIAPTNAARATASIYRSRPRQTTASGT